MSGKIQNFYVKKMQKFARVLIVVLLPMLCMGGCSRKDEDLFLILEEEAEDNAPQEPEEIVPVEDVERVNPADNSATEAQDDETVQTLLYVHVCGAVENPGVYELPDGSRVFDAVNAAGGFVEAADEGYVNQAQCLEDGMKLVIPTVQEVEALSERTASEATYGLTLQRMADDGQSIKKGTESGLVNLNTAGREELMTLPGIGKTRADAILEYRARVGTFTKKEQIMEISGIKSGLYSEIKDKICVE